jgi:hypothetical protein
MSRHGISRPRPEVRRAPAVPHDCWLPKRLTGIMTLRLQTLEDRFVSPGTGRLALSGPEDKEVAERAARSNDRPVLPGSGIKGAVRTLYELLSFSCNPFDFSTGCKGSSLCDACSLFGARGHLGRVSFSDAVAEGPDRVSVRRVPMGHEAHGFKTPGDFRLYDLDLDSAGGAPPRERYAREVFTGTFLARLAFTNASPEELGRLFLCLGFGEGEEVPGFPLRLGGVKYDGQGAVRVTAGSLAVRVPRREELKGDASAARVAEWIAKALASPWAASFRPTYDQLSKMLRTGGKTP